MALGVVFLGKGYDAVQHWQVHNAVTPDNTLPHGLKFHAAGTTEDGFCLLEIWEPWEAAGAFFHQKFRAKLERANVTLEPTVFDVVNTIEEERPR